MIHADICKHILDFTSAIAGSNTYTSPNAVVLQIEFGPGLPYTLFIWQGTEKIRESKNIFAHVSSFIITCC